MALIKCPECENDISEQAKSCPHCGYPLSKTKEKSRSLAVVVAKLNDIFAKAKESIKSFFNKMSEAINTYKQKSNILQNKKVLIAIIASVICLVLLVVFAFSCSSNGRNSSSENNSKQLATEVSFGFIDYNDFSQYWFDGVFRCGTDFDAGEYYILPLFGAGAMYEVSDTPDGFSWSFYRLLRKVDVQEGEYVNVAHGAIMVPADEVDTSNWYKYGVFLVGKDILAGEYRMETIYDEYRSDLYHIQGINGAYQLNENDIEAVPVDSNYLFDTQKYILLEDGQYIVITNIKLTNVEVSDHSVFVGEEIDNGEQYTVNCDANGHQEGEWQITEEATLVSVGVEELQCSVCGESLDSRGTECKKAKVIGKSFNFKDEEFIDWVNSWDKNFEVSNIELGMGAYSSQNTSYEIKLWSTGSEGILILNHDDSKNITGIMAYFEEPMESAAFISVIAKRIEYDFSTEDAGEELIDNKMAYTVGDVVVMRLNLADDFEVTLLAPFEYVGELIAGSQLTKNDCLIYIENGKKFAKYNYNAHKYILGEYGEDSLCYFYHDDGGEVIEDDIGNMMTFRGISLAESTENDVISLYGSGDEQIFKKDTDVLYQAMSVHGVEEITYLNDTVKVILYDYMNQYQIAFYIDNDGVVDFIAYFDGMWY